MLLSHVAFWTGEATKGVLGGLAVRGEMGVAVFFALSALLLSTPFVRRGLGTPTTWRAGTYAVRRAARILPAYYLALVGVVAAAALIGGAAAGALDPWSVLVHLVIGQGLTGETFQSFTQTWSLTTEVTFYVLLPVLAAGCAPLVRAGTREATAGRMLLVCGGFAAMGLAVQALAHLVPGQWSGVLATSAAGHAAWFALGVALAVVLEAERAGIPVSRAPALEVLRTSPGTLLVLSGVLWLVASTSAAGPRGLTPSSATEALVAEVLYGLVAACLLCAATTRGLTELLASSPLAARTSRWLGDISYSVFLWHVLVLQVTFAVLDLRLFAAPFWSTLLLVTVVSVGLAHLSWTVVERRVLARAHRDRAAPAPRPAPRD